MDGTPMPSALQRWREFASAAANGWQRTHGTRPASLVDRDTFGINEASLVYDNRDCLGLFRRLVDEVVFEYQDTFGDDKPLLFVVAVDNVDLNPDRVEEFLQLVGHFTHPRLAVVFTGFEKMIVEQLRCRAKSLLSEPEPTEWSILRPSTSVWMATKWYEFGVPPEMRVSLDAKDRPAS